MIPLWYCANISEFILDSLCYEILTDDVYEDMKPIKDLFDTSNYGSFNKTKHLFSSKYKKVVGKFKDELGGEFFQTNISL